MNAALFYRCANNLSEQRFRDEARIRMMSRGRGERTAIITANKMSAFALVKSSGASKLLQNTERCFDPLRARFALDFEQVVVGHSPPHFSHRRAELFGAQFPRQNSEQEIEERSVGFWENLLRLGREGVSRVWFSKTGLRSRLMNQPVAFQAQKVRSHRIVG